MMNRTHGLHIAQQIGAVIDIDVDKDGLGWGPFLQVKVWMKILEPLLRSTLLNLEGNNTWVGFKYERLPYFCFKCGVLFHSTSGCKLSASGSKLHNSDQEQYGTWLLF